MIKLLILVTLTYSILEKYNDQIILLWQKTFRPGFTELTSQMSEIEILRNFVWNEKIPTIIFILIIINLYKGFSSKESHKEDYSSCIDFKSFLKRFNKRKNPIRNALLVSNSLVLFHQIYKQVKYRYGFPYLYGPLFIILPIIYILIDIVSSYVIWKKST